MEFFTHPWYMAAGGALVSSPILIHLINRMRFKRIRWAAMEFLLKSQKRNRRRLIIEQLILLMLRILLVLLAGFLVARFLFSGAGARGATHIVIVDDTMSMADKGQAGPAGQTQTAYETAIEQIKEIAKNAAQAASSQQMQVYLLSDLDRPLFEGRLGDVSVARIDDAFTGKNGRKPTLRHVRPLVGIQQARKYLDELKPDAGQKNLHFVSDFRDPDWNTGADSEKLTDEVKSIIDSGINVTLIDVATPYRTKASKLVQHHDNLALTDLKADTRVAVEDAEVELTASIINYAQAEARTFLQVYVNGEHDLTRDMPLEKLRPGEVTQHKFTLRFPKRGGAKLEINEKDGPEERERKRRMDREYFNVRVTISRKDGSVDGLDVDNVRDLIIEVRKKVPSLVVDGNKPEGRGEAGDMSHLQAFYSASGVYEIEERRLLDLEKADLDLYPSIILLNVAEIPPAIVKRLKLYVENGGSLCYFMGEEVKPEHYNAELFKAGIFPLRITDRPHDPLAAAYGDPDQRKKERERLRQTDPTPKILFPRPDHPLVSRVAPFRSAFRYLGINVYWKAEPRSTWDPEPRRAETLIVLPNAGDIDRYRRRAGELANEALSQVTKLATKEKELQIYVSPVDDHVRRIKRAVGNSDLFQLSEALEDMLKNPGVKDDKTKPDMTALWKHVELKALAAQISEFREEVLYGDPLVVSKQVGKGRVVAMLTTAGTSPRRGVAGEETVQWNNWGAGEKLVSQMYPLFLLDMQRYLVSEGQAPNRLLGEPIAFQVDAARYDPRITWTFTPQPDMAVERAKIESETEKGTMQKEGNRLSFNLGNINRPGVYTITRTLLGDGAEEDRQEKLAYACNVDALAESNLKRASKDQLVPEMPSSGDSKRGQLTLWIPGESDPEKFKERQPDASEWPWLYLFIILILVVEQAMAVHLSHHTRLAEGAPESRPAPSPTPAAA